MLRSLRRYEPQARIVVGALDEPCGNILLEAFGDSIDILRQCDLLETDPDLAAIRDRRKSWPFYATQKPAIILSTLLSEPPGARVVFIDADTWFYSSPEPAWNETGEAPIGLSPHRFSPDKEFLVQYGLFNAGCIYFRNDETALRCVADWRAQCLEWCEEEPTADGRFMNQGYLNFWPEQYPGVHVIRHPGLNLAPWNVNGHYIQQTAGGVFVNGQPLIFYHFSGMHCDRDGNWYSLENYFTNEFETILEAIYKPYAAMIEAEHRYLSEQFGLPRGGSVRDVTIGPQAVLIPAINEFR